MSLIWQALYLMLPAYGANMAPVLAKSWHFLEMPVDFGVQLRNKPLFGPHKTIRGIGIGIVTALVIAFLQFLVEGVAFFQKIGVVQYEQWWVVGLLLGGGALAGDLIASGIKRQLDKPSGKSWIPFDQLDFVVGALLLLSFVMILSIQLYLTIIIISFLLHIIVNHSAFYLGIRAEKW